MEKLLKVRLHIISPVHIGCDDVYEPTGFIIDEKEKKLIVFDPLDFIKSLSPQEREKFTSICAKGTIGSILEIYRFFSNRKVPGRKVDIPGDLVEHFNEVKALSVNDEKKVKQKLNQFSIYRTTYNSHNNLPYIPGSSIKGALRTAYLSKLAKDEGVRNYRGKAKDLEFDLLKVKGGFDSDPFRMVKVSDFLPVGDVRTKIVYAVNKKKTMSKFAAQGPFSIIEVIKEGSLFEGVINIQPPEKGTGIKKPVQIREFLKSINGFFINLINSENKIAKEISADFGVVRYIKKKFEGKIGISVYLARLGRHSGAEAVTIEGNRWIKIMQGKGQNPKYLDHATTIWLSSEQRKPESNKGLIPFGWTVMEML